MSVLYLIVVTERAILNMIPNPSLFVFSRFNSNEFHLAGWTPCCFLTLCIRSMPGYKWMVSTSFPILRKFKSASALALSVSPLECFPLSGTLLLMAWLPVYTPELSTLRRQSEITEILVPTSICQLNLPAGHSLAWADNQSQLHNGLMLQAYTQLPGSKPQLTERGLLWSKYT